MTSVPVTGAMTDPTVSVLDVPAITAGAFVIGHSPSRTPFSVCSAARKRVTRGVGIGVGPINTRELSAVVELLLAPCLFVLKEVSFARLFCFKCEERNPKKTRKMQPAASNHRQNERCPVSPDDSGELICLAIHY